MYYDINSSYVHGLAVLKDNITWIWVNKDEAVVVDPAITNPVKDWLIKRKLKLLCVLQTHHHSDHIGGTQGLIKHWPKAAVVASRADANRIPFQTISVTDQDEISFMGNQIKVLNVAGHTSAHVAYYISNENNSKAKPYLFCGDTLFGAGCGRIFEGTAEEMHKSLNKLKGLPNETLVFSAHEYTESNLRWALSIYPEDKLIEKRLKHVMETKKKGSLSLPSSILEEKETNLFFRSTSIDEFSSLRLNKDKWQG